jgi:hypothetical protein
MADAVIFMIEQGQFALEIVDTAEVGYSDAWLAPGGKTVDTVVLADYDASSATFMCQVTSGALTATADTTTVDVPATFCNPAKSIPQPGETAYALDLSILQDPNVAAGISRYLFEHDTEEAFFYLGFNAVDPPKAIGRCKLTSATIGGGARTVLTADISLPCSRKPSIEFGDATTSVVIPVTGALLGATTKTAPASEELTDA